MPAIKKLTQNAQVVLEAHVMDQKEMNTGVYSLTLTLTHMHMHTQPRFRFAIEGGCWVWVGGWVEGWVCLCCVCVVFVCVVCVCVCVCSARTGNHALTGNTT